MNDFLCTPFILDEFGILDELIYINDLREMKEINHRLANYDFKKNEINNKDFFVTTFKSKPIKGIVLELQTINKKCQEWGCL